MARPKVLLLLTLLALMAMLCMLLQHVTLPEAPLYHAPGDAGSPVSSAPMPANSAASAVSSDNGAPAASSITGTGSETPPDSIRLEAFSDSTNLEAFSGSTETIPLTEVMLAVENIPQLPELPNGCEGTSLAIVLNYFGVEADKIDVSMNYIPRMSFADGVGHPDEVYMGDPSAYYGGYYCFAPPVAAAAARYIDERQAPLRAYDATGSTEADLVADLNAGLPVIVWITTNRQPPAQLQAQAWTLSDGSTYAPYYNLHVAVLRGYDADNFYLCDPLQNFDTLPREEFLALYTAMGSRAVALLPLE